MTGFYEAVFAVAAVLEGPVVIATLLALALTVVDLGAFVVERVSRRRRGPNVLADAADAARAELDAGDRGVAMATLAPLAHSERMRDALADIVTAAPAHESRIAKRLADFDFASQRRLGRTRILVRLGPALGLMGTLIPLSPALSGLASGDLDTLTENLRVAFSITVLGILIGVVAFALSLVRERLYGQDHSDLEFVAAVLTEPTDAGAGASASTSSSTPAATPGSAPGGDA